MYLSKKPGKIRLPSFSTSSFFILSSLSSSLIKKIIKCFRHENQHRGEYIEHINTMNPQPRFRGKKVANPAKPSSFVPFPQLLCPSSPSSPSSPPLVTPGLPPCPRFRLRPAAPSPAPPRSSRPSSCPSSFLFFPSLSGLLPLPCVFNKRFWVSDSFPRLYNVKGRNSVSLGIASYEPSGTVLWAHMFPS